MREKRAGPACHRRGDARALQLQAGELERRAVGRDRGLGAAAAAAVVS
jgi:hypothetical protein